MSETIPPAMTPGEWKHGVAHLDPMSGLQVVFADGSILFERGDEHGIEVRGDEALMAVIAAAMSQLSDGHPAKLTREMAREVRSLWPIAEVEEIADALESYLPPEGA